MKTHYSRKFLAMAVLATIAGPVLAADQDQLRTQDQTKAQDQMLTQDQINKMPDQQIYGSQLMTQQERDAHRAKMRSAKTYEEQQRIRNEHHQQMQVRAKERGVTLPDAPPAGRGPGMGPGPGGGMGPGSGGGMGPGGGGRY
ncbi:MAG: hypothetical protein H6R47_1366 [Proteobacteria bacterium]|nr:hypothetical protein [Pseudomonadota bacterium]